MFRPHPLAGHSAGYVEFTKRVTGVHMVNFVFIYLENLQYFFGNICIKRS